MVTKITRPGFLGRFWVKHIVILVAMYFGRFWVKHIVILVAMFFGRFWVKHIVILVTMCLVGFELIL
jgi:hypothetical protein